MSFVRMVNRFFTGNEWPQSLLDNLIVRSPFLAIIGMTQEISHLITNQESCCVNTNFQDVLLDAL